MVNYFQLQQVEYIVHCLKFPVHCYILIQWQKLPLQTWLLNLQFLVLPISNVLSSWGPRDPLLSVLDVEILLVDHCVILGTDFLPLGNQRLY